MTILTAASSPAWRSASASRIPPAAFVRSAGADSPGIAGPGCIARRSTLLRVVERQAAQPPLRRFLSPSAHSGREALVFDAASIRTHPASAFGRSRRRGDLRADVALAVFRFTRAQIRFVKRIGSRSRRPTEAVGRRFCTCDRCGSLCGRSQPGRGLPPWQRSWGFFPSQFCSWL